MKYFYQARSKEGKIETGTVEASSKEAAALLLQKYNVFVTSLKEQNPFLLRTDSIGFLNKLSKKDLAVFSRELAVLLQARVPVTQSLKGLAIQVKNAGFKEKVFKIAQLVEEGNPLSESMANYPETFNAFYISLVKTGEASGKISDALSYLSDHLEREADINSQIVSALIYPVFVIVVMLVVIPLVIMFVIPKLVDLLKETTSNSPPFTQAMINFYGFLASYGWLLIVIFFGAIAAVIIYFRSKAGRKTWDVMSLKIPFLSGFLKKTFLIKFAENISTLVGAGLSITKALKITQDIVSNSVYKNMLSETEKKVSEGEKISSVLIKYPELAPAFVVQMIQVGEETGTLDKNLMQIVNFYNKEVQRAIATFTALLEPVLIVIMGIGVALLAVSVIQPLYGALGTI